MRRLEDCPCVSQVWTIAHVRLDDRHAGLDQPARQQERLAEHRPAVAVADSRVFAVQVEGASDLAREQERIGQLPLVGERVACEATPAAASEARRGSNSRSKSRRCWSRSTLKPSGSVRLSTRKSGSLGSCRICQGSCFGTEESGVLAGPEERAFHEEGRQHHPARESVRPGSRVIEPRGVARIIVARGDLVEDGARLRVPGQDLVRGVEVVRCG